MTYEPYPTIEIGSGTYFTNETIANISVTMGRKDVLEQPAPGFARVELFTDANTPLNINLSDSVRIAINKGTTGTQEIFHGVITDVEISLSAFGEIGSLVNYTITAVGPLAQLNRRLAGASGFPKQFDGTRILAILSEAFLSEWDDISATLTWSAVPATSTWANFDGVNQDLVDNLATTVDVPGQYELHAYTSGEDSGLTLAQNAAASGRGVLWETSNGELVYDDYLARSAAVAVPITADEILSGGISIDARWGEIVNDIRLTYKANAEKVARDENSIFLYGQLIGTKSTELENGVDAQSQANDYLISRAYPRTYPDTYTIALHNPNLTAAKVDTWAGVYCGMRIATNQLPLVFGGSFDGFVEGWNWSLTRYTANLTIFTSKYSETYPTPNWYVISPTLTWAAYNPIIQWEDL